MNTEERAFDIVIPCYNYGRFLECAVQSVLSQNVELRVLIIDDCSQDNSADIGRALAACDPRIEFRRHKVNRGHIATYNEGIEWASRDFFLLLSADDLLLPGALSRVAAAFAAEPRMTMVHGRAIYFSEKITPSDLLHGRVALRVSNHPLPGIHAVATELQSCGQELPDWDDEVGTDLEVSDAAEFWRLNMRANQVHTATAVTRTELQKVLLYRSELPHSGDYEMWLRFAAHGTIGFVPRFQAAARLHSTNMSRDYDGAADLMQRVLAIDWVERECSDLLPSAVQDEMKRYLAEEAIRITTGSERGKWDPKRKELVDLAFRLDPNLRLRWSWLRYKLKSTMGPKLWWRLRDLRYSLARRQH